MSANGTSGGTAVLERVRETLAKCDAQGEPRPSQNDLADRLRTSRHQVRKALAHLADEPTNRPAPWRLAGDLRDGPRTLAVWHPPTVTRQPPAWRPPAHVPPAWRPAPVQPSPAPAAPASKARLWPLVVIGLAAAVAIWSGWVGLGGMTGFGPMPLLPGIWDDLVVNTAVVLPISLEAYAAFALRVWLTGTYSARTTRLAKRSALGALGVGGSAQVIYHLLAASGYTVAPWLVTMLVSCVPVAVLALAASLAHLVRQDRQAGASQ